MTTTAFLPLSISRQVLGPEDLRRAADAFEMALHALDEATCAMNPYLTRQMLARLIIERALSGDQDPAQMCASALEELRQLSSQESPVV